MNHGIEVIGQGLDKEWEIDRFLVSREWGIELEIRDVDVVIVDTSSMVGSADDEQLAGSKGLCSELK